MKERPIIFSTPMVQAILEGRKTQTRRVIKPQPIVGEDKWEWAGTRPKALRRNGGITALGKGVLPSDEDSMFQYSCPYGKPGDLLWVRESLCESLLGISGKYYFKADLIYQGWDFKWKPSIHMPKEAARIWFEVVDVRVERLNEISEDDAIAEGVAIEWYCKERNIKFEAAKTLFKRLWGSIHGEGSWEKNPWVWVIEFEVVSKTGRP